MSERTTTELHWPATLDRTGGQASIHGTDQLIQIELFDVERPTAEPDDQGDGDE